MAAKQEGVTRIHHGGFHRAFEEIPGVLHEVLIQGVRHGEQEDGAAPVLAAHTPAPLPCCGDGARIADQDCHVQPADVDAHFQSACGDDTVQLAGLQSLFDLPPFAGQITRTVGAEFFRQLRRRLQGPLMDQLGDLARFGEDDGLVVLAEGCREQPHRRCVQAACRVDEKYMAGSVRRATAVHHLERQSGEPPREFPWIGDGGGSADEDGFGAVKATNPAQTVQDMQNMAAKNALVAVQLVDDHEGQVTEEAVPLAVVGQQPLMEHVRVGEQDVGWFPPEFCAHGFRGVTVVDLRPEPQGFQQGVRQQVPDALQLVLCQRLDGE